MANKDRVAVESGLNDLLGNVIKSDRQRSGRGEEPPTAPIPHYDIMTSPTVMEESHNKAIGHYDNNTITQDDGVTEKPPAPPRKRPTKSEPKDERTLLERRIEEAGVMAQSATTTVTLRIPHALNEWLDEYMHGAWPQKVKKQELVVEALRLLYARRGRPKEAILPTELLPETEKS